MDAMGDRLKMYEKRYAGEKCMPLLPICVRLDGRSFSKWTKGLERPYDKRMSDMMRLVTSELVKESGAIYGYTQSDEISLIFYSNRVDSQVFFDGKVQKMVSVLAALASVKFNYFASLYMPLHKVDSLPVFDCRVWTVPNKMEAANVILWREMDATKNSISMACSHYYSHLQMHKKHQGDQHDMLMEKGVNWNYYPIFFKRGVHIRKTTEAREFTAEEMLALPAKHEARENPDLLVERSYVDTFRMGAFTRVVNRVEVIFDGAEPIYSIGDEDA